MRRHMLWLDPMAPHAVLVDKRWSTSLRGPFLCTICKDFRRDRMPSAEHLRMYVKQTPTEHCIGGGGSNPPFGLHHTHLLEQLRAHLDGETLYYDCYTTDRECGLRIDVGDTGNDDPVFAKRARKLVDYVACVPLRPANARCGEVVERKSCPECGRDMTKCDGPRWNLWASEIGARKVVMSRGGSIFIDPDVATHIELSKFPRARLNPIDVDDR